MGSKTEFLEDAGCSYIRLDDDGIAAAADNPDDLRLKQLGYKQELSRSLSYVKLAMLSCLSSVLDCNS